MLEAIVDNPVLRNLPWENRFIKLFCLNYFIKIIYFNLFYKIILLNLFYTIILFKLFYSNNFNKIISIK